MRHIRIAATAALLAASLAAAGPAFASAGDLADVYLTMNHDHTVRYGNAPATGNATERVPPPGVRLAWVRYTSAPGDDRGPMPNWKQRSCMAFYPDYNPATNTFTGKDGLTYMCQ